MVKLLLWNVDLTPDLSISSPFRNSKERYPKIARILNEYDIVVLNEAFLYREELLRAVEHQYKYTDSKPWYKFFNSGLVILSKYEFSVPAAHHYEHNSYWDVFISKGILKVSFNIEGKKVDLYGTHMQQYNDKCAQTARKAQVYELVRFVNRTHAPGNDVILVGDLNMGPVYDRTFTHFPNHYSNVEDAKLRDEQYNTLVDALQLDNLVGGEDICQLLHRGDLNAKRIGVPEYNLSDTGAYCLEF